MNSPRVGIGLIIVNDHNELLLGQRKNSFGAGSWGPIGGHLEFGENFTECAQREALEEAGLVINNIELLIGIDNTIYPSENKHYVSIIFGARLPKGQEPINCEPDKLVNWQWFNVRALPTNLFLPLHNLIVQQGLEAFIHKLTLI